MSGGVHSFSFRNDFQVIVFFCAGRFQKNLNKLELVDEEYFNIIFIDHGVVACRVQ